MVTPEKILQIMNSWQSGEVIAVRRKKCSGSSSRPTVQCIRHRQPTAIFAISSLVFLLKDTDTDITQNPPCYCYRSLINVARVIMSSLWPAEKLMRCIVRICKFSSRDFQGRWMPNKMVSNFWIKQVKCKSNKKHFVAPHFYIYRIIPVSIGGKNCIKLVKTFWKDKCKNLNWI